MQNKYRTLQKSAERLKEKVLTTTEENGVTLDEESESFLTAINMSQDTISHMEHLSSKPTIRHIFCMATTVRSCLKDSSSWYEMAPFDDTVVFVSKTQICSCL
ncbi:hypothetical protein EMCRGX_G008936 [Ephydatia muelleri]